MASKSQGVKEPEGFVYLSPRERKGNRSPEQIPTRVLVEGVDNKPLVTQGGKGFLTLPPILGK